MGSPSYLTSVGSLSRSSTDPSGISDLDNDPNAWLLCPSIIALPCPLSFLCHVACSSKYMNMSQNTKVQVYKSCYLTTVTNSVSFFIIIVGNCHTWSGSIPTARHSAVLPASFRVSGVTPRHPLVVGVTTVVLIQASGKQQTVKMMMNTGNNNCTMLWMKLLVSCKSFIFICTFVLISLCLQFLLTHFHSNSRVLTLALVTWTIFKS